MKHLRTSSFTYPSNEKFCCSLKKVRRIMLNSFSKRSLVERHDITQHSVSHPSHILAQEGRCWTRNIGLSAWKVDKPTSLEKLFQM